LPVEPPQAGTHSVLELEGDDQFGDISHRSLAVHAEAVEAVGLLGCGYARLSADALAHPLLGRQLRHEQVVVEVGRAG
jgi:hypothetical protein